MERVGGPIESLARDLGLWGGVKLHRIRVAWSGLFDSADSMLSLHCEPASLEFGRLVVNVENSLWLSGIRYRKNDMLRKLEPYGVKSLTLRVGDVPERKKPPRKKRLKPGRPQGEDAELIDALTQCLPDAELKLAAKRAIARSMGYAGETAYDGGVGYDGGTPGGDDKAAIDGNPVHGNGVVLGSGVAIDGKTLEDKSPDTDDKTLDGKS